MATIYYKIFKHHKRADGTYNVKYCLTHKGKQVYAASPYSVSDKQLIKSSMTIRDMPVLYSVMREIDQMSVRLQELGMAITRMGAKEVLQHITTAGDDAASDAIDFIAFCRRHVEGLKRAGRDGTARALQPVVNNLIDFFGSEVVLVTDITSRELRRFEEYLSKPRRITRKNQFGEDVTTQRPALTQSGLHTTMRDLRVLFNACRREYNTELHTAIPNYPFDYYKIPKPGLSRQRGGDLSAADVALIRDTRARPLSRKELARDIFMLSFYLCGMNAKDIFEQDWTLKDGRLTYGRAKTKGRRSDGALISVAVPEPAAALLARYTKRYLHNRYSGYDTFLTAVGKGMRELPAGSSGEGITFYHARHTFASLAFNKCGFSKDEVAAALNHVDRSLRVTERYIAVDWSVIDRVQNGVLALLPAADDDVV